MVRRRQILLTTLAAGATGIAGCTNDDTSDDSTDPTDEQDDEPSNDGTPTDLERRGDGIYEVDIGAISDGQVQFHEGGVTEGSVVYVAPIRIEWMYGHLRDADVPESFEIDPVLNTTDDAENLFVAPVYDADAGNWTINAYADETYYETWENHQIHLGKFMGAVDDREIEEHDAAFTEHHDGVYRASVDFGPTPGDSEDPRMVHVSNMTVEAADSDDTGPEVGGYLNPNVIDRDPPEVPNVEFSFEYDDAAQRVTITHESGETLDGESTWTVLGGDPTDKQFSGEIAPGDQLTVTVTDASPGDVLMIAWTGPETDDGIPLGSVEIPE
ncbi:hypothetical protein ACT4ML_07545 [Natrinema sp. LN54]|uniref:hypothetical protein n=1 Tax=Natrinema sp. LN54 TaxID=3458705 RepID=UPI0040372124